MRRPLSFKIFYSTGVDIGVGSYPNRSGFSTRTKNFYKRLLL